MGMYVSSAVPVVTTSNVLMLQGRDTAELVLPPMAQAMKVLSNV